MELSVTAAALKLSVMTTILSIEFIAHVAVLMERSKMYLAIHKRNLRQYDKELAKAPADRRYQAEALTQFRAFALRGIENEKDLLRELAGYLESAAGFPPAG